MEFIVRFIYLPFGSNQFIIGINISFSPAPDSQPYFLNEYVKHL